MLEFADTIQEMVGVESRIEFRPRPIDHSQVGCPDTTLPAEVLGWKPEIAPYEGLRMSLPCFERMQDASY